MEQPFLFAVKLTLGERYTDNMDHIYKIVIHLIIQKMEEACKDEFKRLQNNGSLANGQQWIEMYQNNLCNALLYITIWRT